MSQVRMKGEVAMAHRYTDMRSVSLTPAQGEAVDVQAHKEGRKAGNLMRRAICKYLEEVGALTSQGTEDDADENE